MSALPFRALGSWPIGNQLAYLAMLVMFLLASPWAASLYVGRTLSYLADEFGIKNNDAMRMLSTENSPPFVISKLMIAIAAVWLVMVFVCFICPRSWILKVTPWYGSWIRIRGQYHGLHGFAAGLRSGRSFVETTEATALLTRSSWVRSCARATKRRLESGHGVASALLGSGFVNRPDAAWIASAEASGHLANALELIAENSQRRFELLWRIRLSWLVPVAVVALGCFVLVYFYAVMGSLTNLIGGLT